VLIAKRLGASLRPIGLEQYVVTDRVHEGSQLPPLADAFDGPERAEHPHEDFLANVVDGVHRGQPRSELDQQQLVEVAVEMLFRPPVTIAQAPNVVVVERIELHGKDRAYFSTD
jgi:hypothetical protein